MSIYDILACPNCHVHVVRHPDRLHCPECALDFPIVNGVPVMFPDGSLPEIVHESELVVRETYDPWVHRIILQSLLDDQIVVEIGSGNMALDDPCIIRMDIKLSPYVDLVADAHFMPFLPESVSYVFSLAVFEHLRNPFQAAQSIDHVLRDGGYIYHECNFVFAYHGYPHHYFNMSLQGLEQVFARFDPIQTGVAPYQMPAFALDMILRTYLRNSSAAESPHGYRLVQLLEQLIAQPLKDYDIYFDEQGALNLAAGTYFCGFKKKTSNSSLIPDILRSIWEQDPTLQERFPNPQQLNLSDNILLWAKTDGQDRYPEIAQFLDHLVPFNKREARGMPDRSAIRSLPILPATYGAVDYPSEWSWSQKVHRATENYRIWIKNHRDQGSNLQTRVKEVYHTKGRRAALRVILYELLQRI